MPADTKTAHDAARDACFEKLQQAADRISDEAHQADFRNFETTRDIVCELAAHFRNLVGHVADLRESK